MLFALGSGGPAAKTAVAGNKAALALLTANAGAAVLRSNQDSPAIALPGPEEPEAVTTELPLDQAKRIVASLSHGSMGDIVVTQTPRGPAIIAIHEETNSGKTHFFAIERRGSAYRVTGRGLLDTPKFRGRKWTVEKVSAREDNRHQLLFTGIGVAAQPGLRLVLYDPAAGADYSLTVGTDRRTGRARNLEWSDNLADSRVAAYRVVLRERMQKIIAQPMDDQ